LDNPEFYRNAWLRAKSLLALRRHQEAIEACDVALAREPALAGERAKIERVRQEAGEVP
jgi:hypothetical protein